MKTRTYLTAVSISLLGLVLTNTGALAAKSAAPMPVMVPGKSVDGQILVGTIEHDVAMADDLLRKGKYADAADLYHGALNRNSMNVGARTGLGMALARQFKLDAAEQQFNKAIELDPRSALAYSGKAMVLLNRLQSSSSTIRSSKESMLRQAREEAKKALDLDPASAEAHYVLGMIFKEEGQLNEAAGEFHEGARLDPLHSDSFAGLGMTRLMQNSLAEAISNFKQAIQLNTGNSTAHYGLGKAYLHQGLVDDAIKELNTSLYQFPNSAPVRLALGSAYAKQGNTVAAIKEWQESIRIKPENAAPYLYIADIRESRGDIEHALAELRSGLEMTPGNPELLLRIADESLRLDKHDDAIKTYETVLNSAPRSVVAAKGLTRALYLKSQKETTGAFVGSNDYERADRLIKRAIQMNPNNMELRLAQAKLRALSGEKVDLKNLPAPTSDGERVAYAEALLAANKFAEASEQMKLVVNNADDAKETFAVADMALMIKDLDSAELGYKKAAQYSGGDERAKRGLDQVARARESARQDLTLANDLSRKKQLVSAVDKYHAAISGNPRVAPARLGLARTLERISPPASKDLREAVVQYKAYMALEPGLPDKEKVKLTKRLTKIESKAYKLEQRALQVARTTSM